MNIKDFKRAAMGSFAALALSVSSFGVAQANDISPQGEFHKITIPTAPAEENTLHPALRAAKWSAEKGNEYAIAIAISIGTTDTQNAEYYESALRNFFKNADVELKFFSAPHGATGTGFTILNDGTPEIQNGDKDDISFKPTEAVPVIQSLIERIQLERDQIHNHDNKLALNQ